jgi:uncharacterized membrane protein YciS (DUF1049 family)
MKIFALILFLIAIPVGIGAAWIWARKKGRTLKTNRNTEMEKLFFSDFSPKTLRSPIFWIGIAVSTVICAHIYLLSRP